MLLSKKILLAACLLVNGLFADIYAQTNPTSLRNPKSMRTNAVMSMDAYRSDRSLYKELNKAKEGIDYAALTEPTSQEAKTWKYKGNIYTLIAFEERLKTAYPDAALGGYEAWMKALELEEAKLAAKNKPLTKIPAKGEFKEGFENIGNALYNAGVDALNSGGYEKSYPYFIAIVNIRKKASSVFAEKAPAYQFKEADATRMAGLSALKAGKLSEGEAIINGLVAKNEIPAELMPVVQNMLVEAYISAKQNDKARSLLSESRKKYPTNKDLLFTEINFALSEGRLSELEVQLRQAIEADPNNVELWFVLANMYDGLFRERLKPADKSAAVTDADEKSGLDYFKKSDETYQKSLKINPKHFNSQYGLGVLYANYANYCVKKSANLNAKDPAYATWSKNQEEAVNKSLAYLLEAEKIEPNNVLALDALKSIYGLKGDSAKFSEYKEKSEKAKK